MPYKKLKYFLILLICVSAQAAFAQYPQPNQSNYPGQQQRSNFSDTTRRTTQTLTTDQELDTLRKKEENKRDSVIFTSKFIRVTSERLLRDSTQTFPLDTGLKNFENYSPLYQPGDPKINLGNTGRSEKDMLFVPDRKIGFDVGLHALDAYLLNPEDINYYNARVPYTVLSLVSGGKAEQIFKAIHTQNIKPNWNFGFNLNFVGSRGDYSNAGLLAQNVSDINAALFTWYESKDKRYNLLGNLIYNNLKSPETGSLASQYDDIFTTPPSLAFSKANTPVKLPNTWENWKDNGFYLKQSYYIGHIDTVKKAGDISKILPTQRVAYTFYYNVRKYNFLQNDADTAHVFPDYYYSYNRSRDSLVETHLQNDFSYSFYLRSKSQKNVKNEAKLDLGLTQDIYSYAQYVSDSTINKVGAKVTQVATVQNKTTFQDLTVKGRLTYKLSDKAAFEGNVNQIVQGRDFGDFIYDAKLMIAGGNYAGKIILDAYTQSSTPSLIYTDWISNHYIFHNSFANQKTNSFSFNYINDALQLDLKVEYFLLSDYLYFTATDNSNDAHPTQSTSPINLLKVTLSKNLAWRRWHFDNILVYQKTDNPDVMRTPEAYTYSSLYYSKLLFNVLNTNIGTDVRYNTPYVAPSYAVGIEQFYNGPSITYSSYPVANVFIKATLYRTNIFVAYEYANQGLFSKGFYTVNRYPMQDAQLKFGVAWTFFN
ncbi:putative porin [Mucilaginibacter sp. X5P1]|uniref:putative porin n=1 Tax=Mucilaginibacter sp. X5P1 TaxID=2723088 RepID=UPI0016191D2F|nr:putative porin [Mucilaginibacter sp. X5P1]